MGKYFDIVNNDNSKKFAFYDLSINWNLKSIINDDIEDGYIVQMVKFKNTTGIQLSKEEYDNFAYYEAWKIEDGKSVDRGNKSDDSFSCGNELSVPANIKCSLGKKGYIEYCSEVYWINKNHELYNMVNNWKYGAISLANGLKSILVSDCPQLKKFKPLFIREKFIHKVDFIDEKIIEESIKNFFKVRYAKHDKSFNNVINEIFDDKKYIKLKERLLIK